MDTLKRTAEEADSILDGVKALIVGLEGCTTPIDFVKETLYPFVAESIEEYLTKHFDEEDMKKDIQALREQAAKDSEEKAEGVVEIPADDAQKEDLIKAVVNSVKWQMDNDRKSTALSCMQCRVLKEGYSQEKIKAELFEDVVPNLQQLIDIGMVVYCFASGSVASQKLLFAYTDEGDLSELISGYYDTTTGPKTESTTYIKIAEDIKQKMKEDAEKQQVQQDRTDDQQKDQQVEPDEILFITDCPDEAEAAGKAGLRSAIVVREGNAELTNDVFQRFLVMESLGELFGDDDDDDFKQMKGDNGELDDDDEDEDEIDEEDDDDVQEIEDGEDEEDDA